MNQDLQDKIQCINLPIQACLKTIENIDWLEGKNRFNYDKLDVIKAFTRFGTSTKHVRQLEGLSVVCSFLNDLQSKV